MDETKIKMNELAAEVHKNAVAHGWWDEQRSFPEILALCHSELSEALEEYRSKRPNLYYKCKENLPTVPCTVAESDRPCKIGKEDGNGKCVYRDDKPEGIAIELADCISGSSITAGKKESTSSRQS